MSLTSFVNLGTRFLLRGVVHGLVDPPEYVYQEDDSRGTLRCDIMIFVGKSTPTLMWNPGSSLPLAFAFQTPTERPPERLCDVCVWSTSIIFSELLWDFSRLLKEEDAHGLPG